MKILLIGKTGQLGGSLLAQQSNHEIYAPGRDILDIESRESCEHAIVSFRPDVVINTAAFHNVPQCEVEPYRAFAVNCQCIRELALICCKLDTLLVNFSTDYVFGGEKQTPYNEDDRPQPLQIYGISRLAGEYTALATAPEQSIIIRTCGLYGLSGATSKGGNFVDKRIDDASSHTELEMGNDQIVSPTYTHDLAKAIFKLIEHPKRTPGIYHLINQGSCTWFEFTQAIYEFMDLDVSLHPVNRGGVTGAMRRPLYSVLKNNRARNELGINLPHWRDALQRYLVKKY